MKSFSGLNMMVNSDFFTIEMLLGYLSKYSDNSTVLAILVDWLRKYPND